VNTASNARIAGYPAGGHHLGGYSPARMIGKEKMRAVRDEEN
jgi:hypothetical protein